MNLNLSYIGRGGRWPRKPEYQSDGACAFDLAAFIEAPLDIAAGQTALVPTGLRLAVPEGWAGLILARSGLSVRGLCLANGVGLIDSDYRGEVMVVLRNLSDRTQTVCDGDRVAQCMLVPAPRVTLTLCHTLDQTGRGEGGFGSTGRGEGADGAERGKD